jgi:hypothetical protein
MGAGCFLNCIIELYVGYGIRKNLCGIGIRGFNVEGKKAERNDAKTGRRKGFIKKAVWWVFVDRDSFPVPFDQIKIQGISIPATKHRERIPVYKCSVLYSMFKSKMQWRKDGETQRVFYKKNFFAALRLCVLASGFLGFK